MSRILTLVILALSPCLVFSQSFAIEPNPVNVEVDLDMDSSGGFMVEAIITNNTSQTLEFKWVRLMNEKPDCWLIYPVDPDLTYYHDVDSFGFDLNANEANILGVYIELDQDGILNAGEAQVVLEVTNFAKPNETELVEYNFTAIGDEGCGVLSVTEIDLDYLQVYPNPTASSFKLKEGQDVQSLTICNSLGEEVKQFNSKNRAYDISDLKKGLYSVRLYNSNGELLKTLKVLKD